MYFYHCAHAIYIPQTSAYFRGGGGCCWHAGWESLPLCLPHLSGFISTYHPLWLHRHLLPSPPPPPPLESVHTLLCASVSFHPHLLLLPPPMQTGRQQPGTFQTTATGGIVHMHRARMCGVAHSLACTSIMWTSMQNVSVCRHWTRNTMMGISVEGTRITDLNLSGK